MTPNELRLGNYLKPKVKLDLADFKTPDITIIDSLHLMELDIDGKQRFRNEPILLTEEWLFNLGFEKKSDSDIPTYFKCFGKFDGEDYEYCFMIYKDIDENFYTQIIGKKIILTNVHKLQNLFFVIADEELTIKIH